MAEPAAGLAARPRTGAVARTLLRLASVSYLSSCTLGVAVATGRLRTGRAHWVHHALFVVTAGMTGAALGAAALGRQRPGLWLLPAAVPLTVIPYAGRSRRHILVAVSAAPFYLAALAADRR